MVETVRTVALELRVCRGLGQRVGDLVRRDRVFHVPLLLMYTRDTLMLHAYALQRERNPCKGRYVSWRYLVPHTLAQGSVADAEPEW